MSETLEIVKMAQEPITVAYRLDGEEWRATALQFDLIGMGKTREAAFAQLKELVNDYLMAVLSERGPVALYNPSDREEWESPLKESYSVWVVLAKVNSARGAIKESSLKLDDVRPLRKRVREFELAAVGC